MQDDAAIQPCRADALDRRLELFRKLGLALLHPQPQLVIDNAQLRYLSPDPFCLGVRTRHALAGVRVLDEALPVPDQHSGIELIVNDAVTPAGVALDRRIAPTAAKQRAHADYSISLRSISFGRS